MADLRASLASLAQWFRELPTVQKILLVGGTAALLALLFTVSLRPAHEEYKVLFSNLSTDDAGAVVAKLKEQRIPYQLANQGTAVLVPAAQVYETRLALAGQGLPRGGGVGFEIFDKQSFGTTEFVQRLNYQRALQGELARTIAQFRQVRSARVHVATPKESVFIEEERPPTASVALEMTGREKLGAGEIKAIVNLVASAVPGLTSDNITVVDTAGRLLYRGDSSDTSVVTASQLEYQFRLEEATRRKVETLLEEVVGVGHARVRVTADIDFDRVAVTEETYDPEGQVVRSEQQNSEENYQGAGDPKGIPGVKGELASFAGEKGGAAGSGETLRRTNVTRNYEISKRVRQVQEAGGAVRRLSVAVMVDGTYEPQQKEDGTVTMQYRPRSQEELAGFERLVKNAIGFDAERGDQVEVVPVSFAGSRVVEPAPSLATKWGEVVDKVAMPIVYLLMALTFVLFVVRPFFRLMAEKQSQLAPEAIRAEIAEEIAAEEELALAPRKMTDKEKIYKLAQSDPARAADLVRRWLREGT